MGLLKWGLVIWGLVLWMLILILESLLASRVECPLGKILNLQFWR